MLRHEHEEKELDAPKNTSSAPDDGANVFTYKLSETKGNGIKVILMPSDLTASVT